MAYIKFMPIKFTYGVTSNFTKSGAVKFTAFLTFAFLQVC